MKILDILHTISVILTKIFGANYRSTILGNLAILSAAVYFKPELVDFLPCTLRNYIIGISGLVAVVSGGGAFSVIKDHKVTGGSVPQTPEAQTRTEEEKK